MLFKSKLDSLSFSQKVAFFIANYLISFLWIQGIMLSLFILGLLTRVQMDGLKTTSDWLELLFNILWQILGLYLIHAVSFRINKTFWFFLISSLLQFAWLFNFILRTGYSRDPWLVEVYHNSPLLFPAAIIYTLAVGFGLTICRKLISLKRWNIAISVLLFVPFALFWLDYILFMFFGIYQTDLLKAYDSIKFATNWKLNLWFLEAGWIIDIYSYNLIFVALSLVAGTVLFFKKAK